MHEFRQGQGERKNLHDMQDTPLRVTKSNEGKTNDNTNLFLINLSENQKQKQQSKQSVEGYYQIYLPAK